MENELLGHFDSAILALREKAKSMKDKASAEKEIAKVANRRQFLVEALKEGDEARADIILSEVIGLGKKLDEMKKPKGLFSFLSFGGKKKPKAEEPKPAEPIAEEPVKEPEPPKALPKKAPAPKKEAPKERPKKEAWLKPTPEDFKPKGPKTKPAGIKPETRDFKSNRFGSATAVIIKEPKPIVEVPHDDMLKVEAEMRRMHDEQQKEIESLRAELKQALSMQKELGSVQRRLADSDMALDGIRGSYSELRGQVASMRGGFDQRQPADTGHLAQEVRELKDQLEMIKGSMAKDMGFTKQAYNDFGLELLDVVVKVSELEHLLAEGDDVTDADVYELKQHMILLEKKLGTLDARELAARRALVDEVKDKRSRMMMVLKKKTVSKEEMAGVTADVAGLREQVNERQARVSQELNKEMHKRLGALDKKLSLVQGALEKSGDRGLKKAHDRINELGAELKAVQQAELKMLRELEAQQEADASMARRLDELHRQVRRKGVNYDEVRKAMDALEKDVGKRGGDKALELRSGLEATRRLLETMEGA